MSKNNLVFTVLLLIAAVPFFGFSRMQKSVITSVEINGDNLVVSWQQVEPIQECFVELTSSDLNSFYSPPEDPVLCDTAGLKTKLVTLSRVQGVSPLYTVIIDNITGEIISNYVMVRGEPGNSNSPPQTPPVHVPLSRVVSQ